MKSIIVKPPTRKELITLRVMILTGVVCIAFFLYALLDKSVMGYAPLYWMLISTFIFTCLKIIHEWIHYFCITVPKTPPHTKTYTVDIFTTFCPGEPYEMIVETLEAIQKITYPHEAYLCDEADDPYLRQVCKRLGVHHVTRTKKIDAKAGNINNALRQSHGELCVVLDPDHVPFPDFLDPIVSHFDNPEIGFVQIVQAYKNYDEGLIARGAAQQTFHFYGPMMMSMNKYGTVLAIGANCTFRRTALDSIGGHAAGLAEDMHTAMQLHAAGWKSTYVPAVLARGLVPSTLSAYFKQQLKWSRGVFELLVTSYPKLFKKFTWQQKLHYGIIPMHYLSGIIFLLNFLIPIVSLLLGVSPIKINLMTFGLIGFPMIASIVIIRHYVQRWVMDDNEKGFHIVGGLLFMGTWWILILGVFYTIIRKPIPYIPTPKDNNEENNWPLNIPNLVVLGISLIAIAVGIYTDPNIYTYFMAGFAGLNCIIMVFNIAASRQAQLRKNKERLGLLITSMVYMYEVKRRFWRLRSWVCTGARSTAILVSVVIVCLTFYCGRDIFDVQPNLMRMLNKKEFFLSGIFSPVNSDGLTSVRLVKDYQKQYKTHFDIVSFYIPWGDAVQCHLPVKVLDSVYKNNSVPMITWEPWESLFSKRANLTNPLQEEKVLTYIANGVFDEYLEEFATEVKSLNRPVFIRFAHEADNPFYPWSQKGGNSPEDFKNAWKYVHDFFAIKGADNVIWVWNPWRPRAIDSYFPGKEYVDWIGVTNLNYGSYDSTKKWFSMQQLYYPFHLSPVFNSGLPVMLAEMGSLKSEGRQNQWFKGAFDSLKQKFPEIKATVFFNSGVDRNLPAGITGEKLDWRLEKPDSVLSYVNESYSRRHINSYPLLSDEAFTESRATAAAATNSLIGVKGVNYTKAENLYENNNLFAKKEILKDFAEMKQNGINAVKISEAGHYVNKILAAANEMDMKIHYEFWMPDQLDFIKDKKQLKEFSSHIIKTINRLKSNDKIANWNLGNPVMEKLSYFYYKPELLYHQQAYMAWLKTLVLEIKKADPSRSVTADVEVGENLITVTNLLHRYIPEIDSYGLVLNEKSTAIENISRLKVPYFFSKAEASTWLSLPANNAGTFMADWQDQETKNLVTFDGLKDKSGRDKFSLCQLRQRWTGQTSPGDMPGIKILRPATTILPNIDLTYHALVEENNEWQLADSARADLKFHWYLVKTDNFGNNIFMKDIGKGKDITFSVADDPSAYRLYLTAARGKVITTSLSTLNTPLE
jgi:cellulose synthase/poly-beta-1,6-N-acetylglucosamine synthase-like glycosyltransferase